MQRCRTRDFYELPSSRETTAQGFLRAPAKIARTGVQVYTRRELGLDGGDTPIRLYRPPEEVAKSARSFESTPMADDHPPGDITARNWKTYAVGDVRDVSMEGDFLAACVIVRDEDAIALVRDGKAELSCGYSFNLDMTAGRTPSGQEYDAVQRDIEGNHVAIVDRGRAGSTVRIADRRGADMPKIHRIAVADQKLTDKITIPGLSFDVELDDTVARSVQDKFDLHAHGIGAAKDAFSQLQKSYDTLQKHADALKGHLSEMGEDPDGDEDDEDESLMDDDDEMCAAGDADGKKVADAANKGKPGYTPEGRMGLRLRLRRALDALKDARAATAQSAIEKLAEERQKVIDAAGKFLAEDFAFKGKGVHDIRLAVISAAAKDEALGPIVKIQIGDVEVPKLKIDVARKAFDTIVAMSGSRPTATDDDGQDPGLSRALLGNAGGGDGDEGGRRVIADADYDPAMAFYAREAAMSRRAANGLHRPGDAGGAEVED